MGAYDSAEVAQLVGLIILKHVKEKMPYLNFGLYRDDGLAIYTPTRGAKNRRLQKNTNKTLQRPRPQNYPGI